MKYENIQEVKEICSQIETLEKLIAELSSDNIRVIVNDASFTIMTIGTWKDCEHECVYIANDFIRALKIHYGEKIKKLNDRLKEL